MAIRTWKPEDFALLELEEELVWFDTPSSNWLRQYVAPQLWPNEPYYPTIYIEDRFNKGNPGITLYEYSMEFNRDLLTTIRNVYAATKKANGKFIRIFKYNDKEDAKVYQDLMEESESLQLPLEAVTTDSIVVGKPAFSPHEWAKYKNYKRPNYEAEIPEFN